MNRVRVLTALTIVAVVLAGSQWGFASSITLTSSGSGIYDYGLTLGPREIVGFDHNATITLSGLSGVTGASVADGLDGGIFTVGFFTPSSVVYAKTGVGFNGFINGGFTPLTIGTLV